MLRNMGLRDEGLKKNLLFSLHGLEKVRFGSNRICKCPVEEDSAVVQDGIYRVHIFHILLLLNSITNLFHGSHIMFAFYCFD